MRMRPRFLTIPIAVGVAFFATAATAAAQTSPPSNPYGTPGTPGYDASSYQCSNAGNTPTAYKFGIVRVTGGRPFSVDSCSQPLWVQAEMTSYPSFYENVAYSKAYAHQVPSLCNTSSPENYTGQYLQAWQIGCAESAFAVSKQPTIPTGGKPAAVWWLDVELGNSWSTSNFGLNQAAIDGAADGLRLVFVTVPIGIYSSEYSWAHITNAGYTPTNNATGAWVAEASCSGTLSGLPLWLYQSGTTSFGDSDTAC
jgi:hypothetical protein